VGVNFSKTDELRRSDALDGIKTLEDLRPWIAGLDDFQNDLLMEAPRGVGGDPLGTNRKYILHFLFLGANACDEKIVASLVREVRGTMKMTSGDLPVLHFKLGNLGWDFYIAENRTLNSDGEAWKELLR
jgi:hypothetical protein